MQVIIIYGMFVIHCIYIHFVLERVWRETERERERERETRVPPWLEKTWAEYGRTA